MIEQELMEQIMKLGAGMKRNHDEHKGPHMHRPPMGPGFGPKGPCFGPKGPGFGPGFGPMPGRPMPPVMPCGPKGPGCGPKGPRGFGRILRVLSETEGLSQIEIAEKLDIRPQSVSEAVHKLEALGFVRREFSDADRRKVVIFLTEKGAMQRAEVQERREYRAAQLFGMLTEDEKAELLRLLKKVNEGA